jgi:hypothetical protein
VPYPCARKADDMTNPTDKRVKPDYAPMPGWVKWLVIAVGVLLLVVVVALLAGGEHGPGRHISGAATPDEGGVVAASAVGA